VSAYYPFGWAGFAFALGGVALLVTGIVWVIGTGESDQASPPFVYVQAQPAYWNTLAPAVRIPLTPPAPTRRQCPACGGFGTSVAGNCQRCGERLPNPP
jgi:hypothetical protein